MLPLSFFSLLLFNSNVTYREKQIRAAEERLLEDDVPRTADEFERLIRSSPNSSFTWIKYMDFMVSMADVEKARSIAERYIWWTMILYVDFKIIMKFKLDYVDFELYNPKLFRRSHKHIPILRQILGKRVLTVFFFCLFWVNYWAIKHSTFIYRSKSVCI